MTQSIATATPEEDRAMQTKYENVVNRTTIGEENLALNKLVHQQHTRIQELLREVKALELLTDAQQEDILEMQS